MQLSGCQEKIFMGAKNTMLVKGFAHLMLWIFCDPPERGGLTLNIVECEKINSQTVAFYLEEISLLLEEQCSIE